MSYNSYTSSQQQEQRERGPQAHKAITNCVSNGAPNLIRVTATAHGYSTNNKVDVTGVIGTTEANNVGWTVTVIDANTFDLVGSVFTHAYVSGGLARLQ